MSKLYGYEHQFSTPLHSEGNSIAERAIQTIQEKINLIQQEMEAPEDNWDEILPVITLSINLSWHTDDFKFHPYTLVSLSVNKTFVPNGIDLGKLHMKEGDQYIPTETLKRLYKVTESLRLSEELNNLVNTPVGGVSYSLICKLMFALLGFSVAALVTISRHHHLMGRRRHTTVIQKLERILTTPALPAPVYPRLEEIEFKPEDGNEDQIHQAKRNVEAAMLQPKSGVRRRKSV